VTEILMKQAQIAEPLRSFPCFCRTAFLPNITESKNGLHITDDLPRTPETAPSNLRVRSNPG